MMNTKTINSCVFLIALLIMSTLQGMVCYKETPLQLLSISSQKPHNTDVSQIAQSQLNPSGLTFNSQYYFVAGTRLDSCNRKYKVTINEDQRTTINRFLHENACIYIQAKSSEKKPEWFEIRSQGVSVKVK